MELPEPEIRHLTFLFADVEGSTRLTDAHPAAAGAGLARYHELVTGTVERHGGRMFERIGDGAYACCDDAPSAVAAAHEIQGSIGAEDWGVLGRLRVRIGLLTGDVEAAATASTAARSIAPRASRPSRTAARRCSTVTL